MTFVQIETRNGMINLDGYSRNKTLKGALKDLAREVAKIDKIEADGILNNIDEMAEMATDMMNISNEWYIEAQEVPCASRYSEKNDEIEYAEGHWYLYIRFFCAPEQESEAPETSTTEPAVEVEAASAEGEVQEMKTARYEIKRSKVDPFDIMCGECPEHYIEWWEDATPEELHSLHQEQLEMDKATPDWAIKEMEEDGTWKPTPADFGEWMKQSIDDVYVRLAA